MAHGRRKDSSDAHRDGGSGGDGGSGAGERRSLSREQRAATGGRGPPCLSGETSRPLPAAATDVDDNAPPQTSFRFPSRKAPPRALATPTSPPKPCLSQEAAGPAAHGTHPRARGGFSPDSQQVQAWDALGAAGAAVGELPPDRWEAGAGCPAPRPGAWIQPRLTTTGPRPAPLGYPDPDAPFGCSQRQYRAPGLCDFPHLCGGAEEPPTGGRFMRRRGCPFPSPTRRRVPVSREALRPLVAEKEALRLPGGPAAGRAGGGGTGTRGSSSPGPSLPAQGPQDGRPPRTGPGAAAPSPGLPPTQLGPERGRAAGLRRLLAAVTPSGPDLRTPTLPGLPCPSGAAPGLPGGLCGWM
ncbi:unnamed protein product [Nyctereutes procyonoides]|uniref:(raccoon dog) hypothetical protein n=1 Tax=Nyctereutes procyonoides TaxID=34880 RepID=A0A811YYZ0_NYCPR|nr:unnamed protein product [Nyctereutes procyonoides]